VAPNVKQHPPPHEPWAVEHLQDNGDEKTCRTMGTERHAGQFGPDCAADGRHGCMRGLTTAGQSHMRDPDIV
jgi:hypothetical protein